MSGQLLEGRLLHAPVPTHTHIYFKIRPCCPVRQCADLDLYGSATELAGCDLNNTRAYLKVADSATKTNTNKRGNSMLMTFLSDYSD